jgi:hypothetical protein
MRLRNVEPGDVVAYLRMRCDPEMMAELGGPMPADGMTEKVSRDAAEAAGICRSTGFRLLGQRELDFNQHRLTVNHWVVDPATVLPAG